MTKFQQQQLNQKIFSLRQAAQMIGATRQTIMKYVYQNDLPHIKKFNKKVFFTKEQLKWLCQAMNYPFEVLMQGGEQND